MQLVEHRGLPLADQLTLAAALVESNRLSSGPLELLSKVKPNDLVFARVEPDCIWSIGFQEPSSGFRAICERYGIQGQIKEKSLTLRRGGDTSLFKKLNLILMWQYLNQIGWRSSQIQKQSFENGSQVHLVARLRANNTRALAFNLNFGFVPHAIYTDGVNGDRYVLTVYRGGVQKP